MPRLRPVRELDKTIDDRAEKLDAVTREKQRARWARLNEYLRRHQGWTVSPPGSRRVRIETPEGSGLVEKLIEAGVEVTRCGIGMPLTGIANPCGPDGFTPVEIVEFDIGTLR